MRFLKGERGKPIYWCMPFRTNSLLSFLVFFHFLSIFVLIFFLLFLLYFSFLCREKSSVFLPFSTGHGKGPFIVPAVTNILLFCPLTVFVWSGCTCRSYKTPTRQRRTHFVLLRAADSFCLVLLCAAACHDVNLLFPHTQSMHSTFPLKLPLLGGLSSQQDVPPKRGLSRGRK